MKSVGLVLTLAFSSFAVAAPPAAPHLTAAATDIQQLEFSYEPVPGVARYELWFRAAPGAPWVKYQEHPAQRAPFFRIGVSVHLLDWQQARYYVKACNPSGCTSSNQVGVDGEQLVAMGYIKPNNPIGQEFFGTSVALSADGRTLAVMTGETIGSLERSITVHVFRRTTTTSGWRREARLLPSSLQAQTAHIFSGDALALSGDGNLLAFGSQRENVPGRYGPSGAGAVYLFRRTGSTWGLTQKLMAAAPASADYFGRDVKIDDAGRTLVISHSFPTGRYAPGTLEVYRDPADNSGQFVHSKSLTVPIENNESMCDGGIALSGDGQTLLRGCRAPSGIQVFNGADFAQSALLPGGPDAFAITYDGTAFVVAMNLQTFAYRLDSSGWVVDGDLTAASGIDNASQRRLAISSDGRIAALGNPWDFTAGLGPVFPPYENAGTRSGGVTILERKSSGWVVRRRIKPGSTTDQWFGHSVALGDNGHTLAVGAPFDASAATGIDGDRNDASVPERGAVWIY